MQELNSIIENICEAAAPRFLPCPECCIGYDGTFVGIENEQCTYMCEECYLVFRYTFGDDECCQIDLKRFRNYLLSVKGKYQTLKTYLDHFRVDYDNYTISDIYQDLKAYKSDHKRYLLYRLSPELYE